MTFADRREFVSTAESVEAILTKYPFPEKDVEVSYKQNIKSWLLCKTTLKTNVFYIFRHIVILTRPTSRLL